MKTLKRIGALVAAVAVLLAMAGCKKTRKAHDGADSAEELLTKVIDFLNGDIQYKEVENWFDWYGCIAYEIINDTGIKCDFFTVRDVIDDLQEDPEYIREHHKEFAEAFEKATGHGIEKPALDRYIRIKKDIDDFLGQGEDKMFEEFRELAPYDNQIDKNRIHEDKNIGYGYYEIPIGVSFYVALDIYYYIDDGKYVCSRIDFLTDF